MEHSKSHAEDRNTVGFTIGKDWKLRFRNIYGNLIGGLDHVNLNGDQSRDPQPECANQLRD